MWPIPLITGIFFAPESPWWLVRKGRIEEAKKSLLRLTSLDRETDFDADETISMIVHTTSLERKITTGGSYLDCFRGIDLRRTEIVCLVWAMQNLSGNSFSSYSTYFLQQAGLPESTSYSFAMGQYAINMVGVFGAWGLMTIGIGRRSLYLYGLCGLASMLMIMGFLGLVPEAHRDQAAMATGGMMIVWAMIYQLTVGTVCYSLVAEISTRRLQIKTVVLGRNLYNIVGIVCSVFTPYMLNKTAWNWGNYTGFFWVESVASASSTRTSECQSLGAALSQSWILCSSARSLHASSRLLRSTFLRRLRPMVDRLSRMWTLCTWRRLARSRCEEVPTTVYKQAKNAQIISFSCLVILLTNAEMFCWS